MLVDRILKKNFAILTCTSREGGVGMQSAPALTLFTGKFLLTNREKRGNEKWREKKENCRREGGFF